MITRFKVIQYILFTTENIYYWHHKQAGCKPDRVLLTCNKKVFQ